MNEVISEIPLDYITIRTTKSRIHKGLLAIPVSLKEHFPKTDKIYLLNELGEVEVKTFTQYTSSSRECRIGGLKQFYEMNNISDGEELVIQFLDTNLLKLIPEKRFKEQIKNFSKELFETKDENEFNSTLSKLTQATNLANDTILSNQFVSLASRTIEDRNKHFSSSSLVNERVPFSLRRILKELYKGRCQISDFTFLTKNNEPYFELHHINANKGNHPKNLLIVSPNVHAQFTYASIVHHFDTEGWLRSVDINNVNFPVFQVIDSLSTSFKKEIHF